VQHPLHLHIISKVRGPRYHAYRIPWQYSHIDLVSTFGHRRRIGRSGPLSLRRILNSFYDLHVAGATAHISVLGEGRFDLVSAGMGIGV
jgi:hypothetical protein